MIRSKVDYTRGDLFEVGYAEDARYDDVAMKSQVLHARLEVRQFCLRFPELGFRFLVISLEVIRDGVT